MTAEAYRPEIDGLRAIAVGAVLLFHVDVPGFSGGYLDVDIFLSSAGS
jgi:peptidoglycan/LPS O-acetylase OafA/YrhL